MPKPSFFGDKLTRSTRGLWLAELSTEVYIAKLSGRRSFSNADTPLGDEETACEGVLPCKMPKPGGLVTLPRGDDKIVPGVFGEESTTPCEEPRVNELLAASLLANRLFEAGALVSLFAPGIRIGDMIEESCLLLTAAFAAERERSKSANGP